MTASQSSSRIEARKLRHRAEKPLKTVALLFSLCVYGLLTCLSVWALKDAESAQLLIECVNDEEGFFLPLTRYGVFFVISALAVVYIVIVWRFFKNLGETVSCDLPVSDRQFANLKDSCALYAKSWDLALFPNCIFHRRAELKSKRPS